MVPLPLTRFPEPKKRKRGAWGRRLDIHVFPPSTPPHSPVRMPPPKAHEPSPPTTKREAICEELASRLRVADLDLATSVRSGLYHQDLSLKLNPQVRIPGTLLDLLNFSHVTDTFPPTAHRLNRTLLEWPQSTIAGRTHPPSRRFAGSGLGPVALCKVLDLVRPPSFCHWTWEDNLTRDFSIVVARFGVGTKNRFVPGVEIYLCPNALVKTHLSQPPQPS